MSIPLQKFRQLLVMAIVNNSEDMHDKAQQFAREQNISNSDIISTCRIIERFFRLYGGENLYPIEYKALIKLQSLFRLWIVRNRLHKQLEFYIRLGKIDSITHIYKAQQIYNILNLKT